MCLRVLSSLEAIIDVNCTNSSTNDNSRSAGYGIRIHKVCSFRPDLKQSHGFEVSHKSEKVIIVQCNSSTFSQVRQKCNLTRSLTPEICIRPIYPVVVPVGFRVSCSHPESVFVFVNAFLPHSAHLSRV